MFKKTGWKRVAEFSGVRVFGTGERNRNGSDRQLLITGCKPGMKVTLRHDPDHPSDAAAIAVIMAGGQQVGVLEPAISAEVAPYLASDDVRFLAKVERVGPMEDEKGRMLAGMEVVVVREDFVEMNRLAFLGFLRPLSQGASSLPGYIGPLSQAIDARLVQLTKGDRFALGIARSIAIFLVLFLVLVVVLTLVSLVRSLFR